MKRDLISSLFLVCALALPASASVPRPLNVQQHIGILHFFKAYHRVLISTDQTRRALVVGKHENALLPLLELLSFGHYNAFGISHFHVSAADPRYVRGEYDALPFKDDSFSLVLAPDLHVWHVLGSDYYLIDDQMMAKELFRVMIPSGYFLADLDNLNGMALHLVHAGFSRLEERFGKIQVWVKDHAEPRTRPRRRKKDPDGFGPRYGESVREFRARLNEGA